MTRADSYLLQLKRSEDFNSLQWHDAKCGSIRLQPVENIHELICEVQMPPSTAQSNARKRCTLRLVDCAYLEAALDLDGKRIVGGALAIASCDVTSDWKEAIQKKLVAEDANSLASYLHFRLRFINPGGEINVLAKDFVLAERQSGDSGAP